MTRDLRLDSVPDRGNSALENIGTPTAKPTVLKRPTLRLNVGVKFPSSKRKKGEAGIVQNPRLAEQKNIYESAYATGARWSWS
jgi:hypothetical protein